MKKTLFICCVTVAFAGMALLTSCKKDKSSITYTVTFNANGGTGTMENQTFTDAVAQILTANNFTKTNYTFAGWATSADGSVVYSNEQSITITANTTLYAQWSVNTYTVTFNANGGTGTMENQTFTDAVAKTLTANNFTKTNYTFAGWATSTDGSVVYSNEQSITITANTTLYAQWTIINPLVGEWMLTQRGQSRKTEPPIPSNIFNDIKNVDPQYGDIFKDSPLEYKTIREGIYQFKSNGTFNIIDEDGDILPIGTYTYSDGILIVTETGEEPDTVEYVITGDKLKLTGTTIETLKEYINSPPYANLKAVLQEKPYYDSGLNQVITSIYIQELTRQ